MKLESRELETRVRKQARTEMRLGRELWKDYKRHRKGWLRRTLGQGNRFLVYVFFLIAIVAAFHAHGANLALVCIALYATATTLFRGINFRLNILRGYDRAVFLHLPIADEDFLRYEWRKFRWSWVGAFALFLLAYSIPPLIANSLQEQVTSVVLAATLQSLCGLSLSMWASVYFPNMKVASTALPLYALTVVCLWLPEPVSEFLWSAIFLVPGGWISHTFAALTGGAPRRELLLLIPTSAVVLSLPVAYRLLHGHLSAALERQTSEESGSVDSLLGNFDATTEEQEHFPERLSGSTPAIPTSHEELFRSVNWEASGWLERTVARWLSERERLTTEFMLADHLGAWSKRWRTAALISVIGIILTALPLSLPAWALFVPIVAAAMWGAPLLGGLWPGFHGAPTFGGIIPIYAMFPVSYSDISRVMVKVNVIRILAWAPLVIGCAVALATRLGYGPLYGVTVAVEVVIVAIATQPVMVMGHFSSGTNDSRQINLHTLSFLALALLLLAILTVSTVGFFVADALLIKSFALLGILTCNGLAWSAYMLMFNRGRIDLLSRPR